MDVPPALLFALIHRSAWNSNSRKFISKILHSPAPIPRNVPPPSVPHSPAPVPLVTPMDRYAELRMLSCVRVHKRYTALTRPALLAMRPALCEDPPAGPKDATTRPLYAAHLLA
jgi:hypothetical protein